MKAKETSNEEIEADLESIIGTCLRYSVIICSSVIVIGLILSPFKFGSYAGFPSTLEAITKADYGRPFLSLGVLASELWQLIPLSIIEAGVIALLAIPFFRVAAGGLMFSSERDWRYVTISVIVLIILIFATFVVGPIESSA